MLDVEESQFPQEPTYLDRLQPQPHSFARGKKLLSLYLENRGAAGSVEAPPPGFDATPLIPGCGGSPVMYAHTSPAASEPTPSLGRKLVHEPRLRRAEDRAAALDAARLVEVRAAARVALVTSEGHRPN